MIPAHDIALTVLACWRAAGTEPAGEHPRHAGPHRWTWWYLMVVALAVFVLAFTVGGWIAVLTAS